jgi:cell division protease FtsH
VNVSFDDVAGLKNAKRDPWEVVGLKEPKVPAPGVAPRGVLLIGPPGTGKTLLPCAPWPVKLVFLSFDQRIGVHRDVRWGGCCRVRDTFEEAKKSAPSIVFIDEIDAVGRSRGTGSGRP